MVVFLFLYFQFTSSVIFPFYAYILWIYSSPPFAFPGQFSCLAVRFRFERYVKSHILNDYVVSYFIIVIAWLSFWIHRDAVPARITLGITTLLTMTTQLGNSSTGTAAVSYLKAIDIWNTFCVVMVFAALMEFALVNVLSRREKAAARLRAVATPSGQTHNTTNTTPRVECVRLLLLQ